MQAVKLKNGKSEKIDFKYEKITTFCLVCGKLGQIESHCDRLFQASGALMIRGWGSELQVTDNRKVSMFGDKWLRREDGGFFEGGKNGGSEKRIETEDSTNQGGNREKSTITERDSRVD